MRIVLMVVLAACGPSLAVSGDRLRTVADAPSGKHLAIYRSSGFATEPRDVPEDVVVQAMRASSMFFEEDIRALAPKITPELGKLGPDQRLVVETSDTAIYMYVATGELQIVSFRDGQEVSRHASAIPSAAVRTELTPRPRPAPLPVAPPTPALPPPASVEPAKASPAAPQPVTIVDPYNQPKPVVASPRPRPAPNPTPAKPAPRLTEAEIRTKLDELDRLRAKQLITQDEYDKKKKALLDQL